MSAPGIGCDRGYPARAWGRDERKRAAPANNICLLAGIRRARDWRMLRTGLSFPPQRQRRKGKRRSRSFDGASAPSRWHEPRQFAAIKPRAARRIIVAGQNAPRRRNRCNRRKGRSLTGAPKRLFESAAMEFRFRRPPPHAIRAFHSRDIGWAPSPAMAISKLQKRKHRWE